MTRLEYLEHEVLVNRFLYYVAAEPILSDYAYDQLEREAREALKHDMENPVHKVGSSLSSSYSEKVKKDAWSRIE